MWVELATVTGFFAALGAVLIWPGKLLVHSLNHLVRDAVEETVVPYLTNGERTVANYAHEAADAAKSANEAAQAARDAAYAAKTASLETKELVMKLRDGK